jgi:serine/threonine-protein kinase
MSGPLDSPAQHGEGTNNHPGQGGALPPAKDVAATRSRGEPGDPDATVSPSPPARSILRNSLPCSFGEYELVEQIARGGMGVVYKARQVKLDRLVALKMILLGDQAAPEDHLRFLAEARAVAAIRHPGIVQLYEIAEHDGLPWFAMEFHEGGSLARKVNGTPLPARQAAHLVEQIARAVQAAHEQNILHRDLKPANVLLDAGGQAKVTDFGLARKIEGGSDLTKTGAIVGTPSYMAPEQARGEGKAAGPAPDVYALGALLYECLTARPPFKASTALETLLQVQSDDPPAPRTLQPGAPRDLETITLKCLHKQPEKRYASAAELADDLGRFLSGEPIAARPPGRVGRLLRWAKRRPGAATAVAAGALALLALTGGLAIGLVFAKRERDVARAERNKALAARARTRAALDEVSSEAIETLLAQQCQLTDRHKAFLRRALELYGEFTADADADAEVRVQVARAHMRMGLIRTTLGELAEAKLALERAIETFDGLTRERPDEPGWVADLAKTHDDLGILQYRMGNRAEAERLFRRAAEHYDALSHAHPDNAKYRINHANTRINWANLLADRREWKRAEAQYRRAIEIHDGLPPEEAAKAEARVRIGMAYYNLAYLFDEMGRKKESEDEYARAAGILEKVVKENPAAHGYARRYSSCLINLGDLVAGRGALEEGEKLVRRGLEIQEGLARDYPAIPEYHKYLGRTLRNLAGKLVDQKKYPGARATYLRCIEVQERLVKQYPKFPEYRRDLGSTYHNLGVFERDTDQPTAAEANFRKALAVQEPLVRQHPTIPEFRQELRNSLDNLGGVPLDRGANEAAEKLYRRAVEQNEVLLARFPKDAEYTLLLGGSQGNVATALAKRGKAEEARRWYARSLGNLEDAVARIKPPPRRGLTWLRNTYTGRATTLEGLDRFADALSDWDRVVQLAPAAERTTDQLRRALCLARGGRAEAAVADAGKLTADERASGVALWWAARVYARAAESGPAGRKEEYASQSVKLLQRAEKAGAFESPEAAARLKEDKHLAGLQARPDFQAWLGKAPPRKK